MQGNKRRIQDSCERQGWRALQQYLDVYRSLGDASGNTSAE